MTKRGLSALLLASSIWLLPVAGMAQGTSLIEGTWEGPWYRGMTSGRATLKVSDGKGSLQLTNSETFGAGPHSLEKLVVDGKAVSVRAIGDSGAALTVDLSVNAQGDQMKGMGKYEGFGVRLELRRAGS